MDFIVYTVHDCQFVHTSHCIRIINWQLIGAIRINFVAITKMLGSRVGLTFPAITDFTDFFFTITDDFRKKYELPKN